MTWANARSALRPSMTVPVPDVSRNCLSGHFNRCASADIMHWPTEDAVSALLIDRPDADQPDLGRWLRTLGVMALGMTPLGLILAGIWGGLLTSAFFIFVWLASMIWVYARHGSLGSANVVASAMMVVVWPAIALFGMLW